MISSEVESLARTGGLGDVVEALSSHLAALGAHVLVVTPLYGVTRVPARAQRWTEPVSVRVGWGRNDVREASVVEVLEGTSANARRVCLLDDPGLFGRNGIYGEGSGTFDDNELRFAALSRGALEIAARAWGPPGDNSGPDVIHAHDWHAALALVYARYAMGEAWRAVTRVFTIHNLLFQGVISEAALDRLAIPREAFTPEVLEHEGQVNLMKGAIAVADRVTTVSPTYAREILGKGAGCGLDEFLRKHESKLVGVVNGIDTDRFDPSKDTAIACRYDAETFEIGRRECKRALESELGLDPGDGPIFGSVSRLTWQKGSDLIVDALRAIVDRGGRVVMVGQGDPALEAAVRAAPSRFPGKVASRIAFDPDLARRIYAGADFFFVPSRFEPCGLTQMYAMRYGSIPIVTGVGGLLDTVLPIDVLRDLGTGIILSSVSPARLVAGCGLAFDLFAGATSLSRARRRAMARDSSWDPSARQTLQIFVDALAEKAR